MLWPLNRRRCFTLKLVPQHGHGGPAPAHSNGRLWHRGDSALPKSTSNLNPQAAGPAALLAPREQNKRSLRCSVVRKRIKHQHIINVFLVRTVAVFSTCGGGLTRGSFKYQSESWSPRPQRSPRSRALPGPDQSRLSGPACGGSANDRDWTEACVHM